MTTPEQMRLMQGAQVYDSAGDPIGTVGAVYVDAGTGEALWLRLGPGLFRSRPALAPLPGAQIAPGRIRLAVDRRQVEAAPPPPDLDQPLPPTLIDDLYRHFGLAATDDAMTRSEERLHTGTERQATARVRLRKYVETEYVHVEVPIRRERVRLEEVPPAERASAAPPSAERASAAPPAAEPASAAPPAAERASAAPDEPVVTLHEERPVIGTETVPVERVRLSKQTVTDTETVHDEVRTEHIEADLPGDRAD